YWFMVTLLTFPMGYIGYFMKKDKWWGILILAPMLGLLAVHASRFTGEARYWFPRHLLSAVFCVVVMFAAVLGDLPGQESQDGRPDHKCGAAGGHRVLCVAESGRI
ncbi:MAG: hypothetical protein K6C06_08970, partial [Lachnospiraceae bacterium]|nr:hypothetical protein [Lachnospiraceae bacterium]